MASFREQLASDICGLFLDSADRDAFGSESVAWTPVGGESRTIEVLLEGESVPELTNGGGAVDVERAVVLIERDATRGTLSPQRGDKLTRPATHDHDQRAWVFRGEIREAWPECFVLIVERRRLTGMGG